MSKKILLADDSVTIQKVVELTFLEEDYEIITVGNGDDALARFTETEPDLVIADIHMPGADGYEVCRRVKDQAPGLPVLLLVGTFEPYDPAEAERCGADRHLKKPFESRDLQRLVEELLGAAAAAAESAAAVEAAGPVEAAGSAPASAGAAISDEDVERIARRVAEILGERAVRDVAWEVIPDLAEVVIKDRLRELESQVD